MKRHACGPLGLLAKQHCGARSNPRRMRGLRLAIAGFLSLTATCALAGNTTTLTLSLNGTTTPNSQVVLQAKLTGTHLVSWGNSAVTPGSISLYANGQRFAKIYPDQATSVGTNCQRTGGTPANICRALESTVGAKYTLPGHPGEKVIFQAEFSGDQESNSSESNNLAIAVRGRSVASNVVNLLFDE